MLTLIADSGSTKTDWVLIANGKVMREFKSAGLNPVHLSKEKILTELNEISVLKNSATEIKQLFFYGAGAGSSEAKDRMQVSLQTFFPAAKISVDNDLQAAAIATCGNEKGMICILGTGSNCGYFDGVTVTNRNFGIGYILGDEASGTYYGKHLLREWLYKKLPSALANDFDKKYQLTREKVFENVYQNPKPAIFLSSFMPFLLEHKDDEWVKQFFENGLEEFFDTHLSDIPDCPVHFVGSVAYSLANEIQETAKQKNIITGKILKAPIEGLLTYFLQKSS